MDKFKRYWRSLPPDKKAEIATKVSTTVGYINKAVSIGQIFGPIACVLIECATDGAVGRKDLRPDDWRDIWPELEDKKAA